MIKFALVFPAVLALSACQTTAVLPSSAIQVPIERTFAFQNASAGATASIRVTRDSGVLGSACSLAFSIDKKHSGTFNPAETAQFFVEPGEHIISVGTDPSGSGLCAVGNLLRTSRETVLRANEVKNFRIVLDVNGNLDLQRSE